MKNPVLVVVDMVRRLPDQEHHEVSLRYMRDKIARVMTNEEIRAAMDG
jgi:isochorismate hydrolase